jgi:hypothetical protein
LSASPESGWRAFFLESANFVDENLAGIYRLASTENQVNSRKKRPAAACESRFDRNNRTTGLESGVPVPSNYLSESANLLPLLLTAIIIDAGQATQFGQSCNSAPGDRFSVSPVVSDDNRADLLQVLYDYFFEVDPWLRDHFGC